MKLPARSERCCAAILVLARAGRFGFEIKELRKHEDLVNTKMCDRNSWQHEDDRPLTCSSWSLSLLDLLQLGIQRGVSTA